jgi:hypothetical protein
MGRLEGKAIPDHRFYGVHVLVHRFEEGSGRYRFEEMARAKRRSKFLSIKDERMG